MGGFLGQLARVGVKAATGALAGDAERQQREIQQAALTFARQRQAALDAEQQDRQRTQDALSGILVGQKPADPMADAAASGAIGVTPQFQQVTPTRYVDLSRTPEARANRAADRQERAAADASARAETVRAFLAKQAEQAQAARDAVQHGYRMEERPPAAPRGWTPQSEAEAIDFAGKSAAARAAASAPKRQAVPQGALKAMIDNTRSLGTIDEALRRVDDPKAVAAFGPTNIGPGAWIKDQTGASTPAEQAARAAVADIGSLVIHDRSGAAVTVSEMPRLAPFIPAASDRPSLVRTKLQHLRDGIQQEHELYVSNYDEAHGYTPPDLSAVRGTATAGTAHPLVQKYGITPPPGRP